MEPIFPYVEAKRKWINEKKIPSDVTEMTISDILSVQSRMIYLGMTVYTLSEYFNGNFAMFEVTPLIMLVA